MLHDIFHFYRICLFKTSTLFHSCCIIFVNLDLKYRLDLDISSYSYQFLTKKEMILRIISFHYKDYNIFSKNSCARLLFGDVKNSEGGASSASLPSSKNRTRSATSRANPISWVTINIVIPV